MRTVWLFDLDNTLHDASAHIFPHINRSMTEYLACHLDLSEAEANALRMQYWLRYGATLRGLMRHHRHCDPRHFLRDTHTFEDLPGMLVAERRMRAWLRRLPGRKVVFSNSPRKYANEVVRLLGIAPFIERVIGVEDLAFQPKPQRLAYQRVLRAVKVPAARCVMVEDTLDNLRVARQLGMRTVWISRRSGRPAFVDRHVRSVCSLRGWQR
ncbi:MAG: pyrimidine 5'-nucleotidase [Moraxellaceae bacterium]|nr:pyrimidine 5'-nucleotidase [Moraxellaceae bacterium]